MSLTASDGTGLKLVSLTARGVVEEPLAFTELHMVFENPTDRVIEGRFEINMPPDAAISRFAMKIGGAWQEGEVVERRAAQVAFEDALHRKQDPALLENKAGNSFSARVFPINARERKELVLSYSQELTSSAEPYRLMLRGLPELESLDATVILREDPKKSADPTAAPRVVELKKHHWAPDQDLEVSSMRLSQAIGLRHDNIALARVAAFGTMPPAEISGMTILFDTSASRSLDLDHQIADLAGLMASLREQAGRDFSVRVICFDQDTEEIYTGPVSGFGGDHLQRISGRRALGASNLGHALAVAAQGTVHPRLLVMSDGVATAGARELSDLEASAVRLAAAGVQRIDAIVDGGIQDTSSLKTLATAALPHKGIVADGRLPVPALAHKLASQTLPDMQISVPGAAWVWPETVVGAQPGDELLVYADLPAEAAMRVVLTGDAKIEHEVATTATERPLLERAWVGARIERLTNQRSKLATGDRDGRDALHKQIVAMSTQHRVLSDFTALLVLETEWDYKRFNIDRNALSDIMTVGTHGVELKNRSEAIPVAVATKPVPRKPVAAKPAVEPEEEKVEDKPQSASKAGLYAMKGPKDAIPSMARNFDPDTSFRDAGLLGMMAAESGHFLASPYGGAFAVGGDDNDVWGGLTGTEVGEAYGVGGLGLVGTGRGGGGTGEGTIGLGSTGLVGKGGGSGSGYGRGSGAGFGGRGTRVPTVRQAKAEVQGSLDKDIIRRIVRAHINEVRFCYNQGLARDPNAKGRIAVQFTIGATGSVPSAVVAETTMKDINVAHCITQAVRRWTFPKPPGGGNVVVTYPFILEPGGGEPPPPLTPAEVAKRDAEWAAQQARQAEENLIREAEWAAERARHEAAEKVREAERQAEQAELARTTGSPYLGKKYDVMKLLAAGDTQGGLALALRWQEESPGDVLALLALGEALEAVGDRKTAARAYGSIIDLFPSRADLRRYVGGRLERLGELGLELAIDTYAEAVAQRPDHPASHRLYAFALAKAGRHADAFAAIRKGIAQDYPWGRFAGADRILREDAALLLAAWQAADPAKAKDIQAANSDIQPANAPSLRFVLTWETDANDVDFHIIDQTGERASYANKRLNSGGELFADVTTGYGPECFAIPGKAAAFPYTFHAHYYSRGPMGYGMGKLQIVQHDGRGGLLFDERPFIIMKDGADVELGKLTGPLPVDPSKK